METRTDKYSGFLLFVAWTLLLILFVSVAGYNGLYGQDSHEYLRYSKALMHFLSGGGHPGVYFWTVNYPLMGSLLAFVTGPTAALQLLSMTAASWMLYMLYQVLLHEFPGREREIIFYVVVFLGCSPYMFRYTVSSMSDISATGLLVAGYYNLYLNRIRHHPGNACLALVLLVLAAFTRIALLPLVIPAAVYAMVWMVMHGRLLNIALALLACAVPLFCHFYFKQGAAGNAFEHFLVTDWSFANYFKSSFETIDGYTEYSVPNILFVFSFMFHPGFLFPGVLFAGLMLFKRGQPVLMYSLVVIALVLYIGFIAGLPARNFRYLVPLLPLWLFMAFPAYLSLSAWLYKRRMLTAVVGLMVVVAQVFLVIKAFQPFLRYNRVEKQLAETIKELNPGVLYTFAVDGALRSYGFTGTVVNMWNEPLKRVEGESMMLFNREAFARQWKNENPMRNYHLIIDSADAVRTHAFDSGWEIYEITKAYPHSDTGVSRIR